ncbi:mucin-13-like, partial [Xiphophorus couchianus]|uniref:mucin-13-like n=1 Tax=Xiphophorus couchianus TaxID=32473 RepID=UPI0010167D5E
TTEAPTTTTAAPTTTTAAPTTLTTIISSSTTSTTAVPTTTATGAPTITTAAPTTTTEGPTTTTKAPTTTTGATTTTTASTTTITAAPTASTTGAPTTITTKASTTSTTGAVITTTTTSTTTTTGSQTTTTSEATTAPTTPPTTTTAGPSKTTAVPISTTAVGQVTTTRPTSACASSPCLRGSICEDRADQTHVCLCLPGEVYREGCQKVKVFPALMVLADRYLPDMANKKSQIFKETSDKITNAVKKEFNKTRGFISSIVLELREIQSVLRSNTGNVEASVQINYEAKSNVTEEIVIETMESLTCESCPLPGSFTLKQLCGLDPCDETTTKCNSTVGSFVCTCLDGYITSNYSERLCMACPPGQKAVNNTCKPCSFGRSGMNCEDESLLILVIVSPILGCLLVVSLITLPLIARKFKGKMSKRKEKVTWKPYIIPSFGNGPPSCSSSGSFFTYIKEPDNILVNSAVPRIPRAKLSSSWSGKIGTEISPSNSRQSSTPSRRNSIGPHNNPYKNVKSIRNPYAQNQTTDQTRL